MTTIPTISQLRAQVQADLESAYGTTIPLFGKNFLRIISAVWAVKLWVQYKYIGFVQKNIFVDTADPESTGGTLERWGRVKLNRNPFAAIAGQYVVSVTGTVGATINANTTFKSNSDSAAPDKIFILDESFQLLTNPDLITLRALEAGVDSKLDVGDELTSTIPIANVNKVVIVDSESIEPQGAETVEQYRDKTVLAFQTEPQGGAGTDYRLWAADAQGVRQVYPYAAYGLENVVDVYLEANEADSTDGFGTPSAGLISDVEDVIDFDPDDSKELNDRGRRPTNVIINVLPIVVRQIIITINGYQNNTAAKQTTILSALRELAFDIRPFVAGTDVLANRNDRIDVNRVISKIYEAVPGSIFNSVTMTVSGSPAGSFVFENGDIPYINSIVYT